MLVDVTISKRYDTISDLIAKFNGNSRKRIKHETGIYEIGHFDFEYDFEEKCRKWANLNDLSLKEYFGSYGVCDNYRQILKQCPGLITSDRKFVISITPVVKANQSEEGGWRWHKWGNYIGKLKPTTEYLYDEPLIDKVYVYVIYELKD